MKTIALTVFLALLQACGGSGSAVCPPCPIGTVCAHKADQTAVCADTSLVCGGFAGQQCGAGFTCVDDPRDDCGPRAADCTGLCVR
jgi:hypothetical protein